MKSFKDIIAELGHDKIDLIKMDIEGSEYKVIDEILKLNIYIPQIVLEIHDNFLEDGKAQNKRLIKTMNENDYFIFAHSRSYQEISFCVYDSFF